MIGPSSMGIPEPVNTPFQAVHDVSRPKANQGAEMELAWLTVAPMAPEDELRFLALMFEQHYLCAPWKIGQAVWYAAQDGSGAWPAMAAFSAAALKCGARDAWIGWRPRDQYGRLRLVANNVRLSLLGRRSNLGSRFLALCTWRIGETRDYR